MNPRDVDVEVFRYRVPLVKPLVMPSGTHTEREGLLLRATDAQGRVGWGDAAPLPGYSPESLNDALRFLGAWSRGGPTGLALGHASEGILPEARAAIPRDSPAAMWAVVQAGAELEAARADCSLAGVYAKRALLGRPPLATVALNALLVGDRDAVLDQARRAVAEGYQAAKLKVGGLEPDEAGALVRDVARALGDVSLRVDANGAWSLDGALVFARALGDVLVEYVEEPLSDVSNLPALARQTAVRWALDESLGRAAQEPAIASALGAAVVKPMLGIGLAWWATLERSSDSIRLSALGSVVVSSVFESGVGMRHLVALAAALGDAPAGLDTYRWLASDLLDRRLPVGGPTVDVAAVLAPNPVRMGRLTPVRLP